MLVYLPGTKMWWPGYGDSAGKVWSNAHGRLNVPGDPRSSEATHWTEMPARPVGGAGGAGDAGRVQVVQERQPAQGIPGVGVW